MQENLNDQIAAKLYLAQKRDKEQQDAKLNETLKQLKPVDEIKITQLPPEVIDKMADWTMAAEFVKALSGAMAMRGERGEKGDTVIGPKGLKGEKGNSVTGPRGERGLRGERGIKGESIQGPSGKDGSPDTPEQLVEKLQSLKKAWIDVKDVKGLKEALQTMGSDFLSQAKGFVSKSLSGMYDVDIKNVTNGQALVWDSVSNKWVAGTVAAAVTTTNFVENEVVSGSGTSFTLSSTPVAGSVHLYGAGQRLVLTTDYSISGTVITTINTWNAGDIVADYRT